MHLPSPPERVFAALASNEGRAAFWAEEAVETGGAVAFRFANGTRLTARILEQRPPSRFVVDLRNHDPGRAWDEGYADQ